MPEETCHKKYNTTHKEALNELALFAGVGGGVLGGRLLGWRSVCYVENNAYCVSVLKARIAEGYLCDAPIWGDIRTFDGRPWAGLVDIITAGFPCQPFSVAGKRKGADDDRNMWPETIRVIREVRPRYALCENVPGLIGGDHGYFGRILDDLSQSGYDARWRIISAADVGAPHLRKRLWIYASMVNANKKRCVGLLPERESIGERLEAATDGSSEVMAIPECSAARMGEHRSGGQGRECTRASESAVLRQENREGCPEGAGTGGEDVSNTEIQGLPQRVGERGQGQPRPECGGTLADPQGAEGRRVFQREVQADSGAGCPWWSADPADAEDATESGMGRVAYGIPCRVDRLKALGNAQVAGVARLAWELLTQNGGAA